MLIIWRELDYVVELFVFANWPEVRPSAAQPPEVNRWPVNGHASRHCASPHGHRSCPSVRDPATRFILVIAVSGSRNQHTHFGNDPGGALSAAGPEKPWRTWQPELVVISPEVLESSSLNHHLAVGARRSMRALWMPNTVRWASRIIHLAHCSLSGERIVVPSHENICFPHTMPGKN